MSHINGIAEADRAALAPVFVPNSFYAMAHWPELLKNFSALAGTVLGPGEIDLGLKQLIAFVVSNAAGSRYCQAHTSHNATRRGMAEEKIQAAFEFETSALFNDLERAALRVALHAGLVPNAVEASHFDQLKSHYSDRQITEIVAVISLFGYLNRWNDTMATSLEDKAIHFAERVLAPTGWQGDKHLK
jgi:AhpD family alkylhydroperoxidase